MASDVLSLFGLNPDVIQQGRIQSGVDAAARMDRDYAIGAAGGQMLGSSLGSAFGLETPEMRERNIIDQSLQGVNLETPEGLRSAAQKLNQAGDYSRAIMLAAEARQLEEAERKASEVKAPTVSAFKTYILGDGTEVQGALVNGVPSMRSGGEWVMMPEDAQPKSTDPSVRATTGITLENARVVLDTMPNFGELSSEDKLRADYWVANEAKKLIATGEYDANTAMQEASRQLNSKIVPETGFSSINPFTSAELDLTEGAQEVVEASSEVGKFGTPVGTKKGGYEFMGGDDSDASNWKELD